ncbi:hypothetical protein PHYBLDRAFT_38351 [Phycomyces blakesleeanus NRRL 1555(-)]|uniref:Rho-GAP domain-containing protein n=1 Tax=Phycomyces blakesleeanus (strain ATCC 8743b / DSM 1359 / FGSC 10004 / NBRC 33097 / NRRL 1555) TaxID=763407 RepID=A0A167N879_PHYB8|nr:hypothetical protein PHYBLDRAFT_38351 [Phycomyces blakesleeanus NRRL 1555(-)]OAD75300.1 hypothetical protein PHYBLDRAFT_38351 [Phycomyces blakesleeanus NRRL 1555(-)]|eukprot:XP_018293340.1 hypothetical protein PHYBLDRAFT_38351 [Phycomyces blakesleeanus NRRL 1555(-)]
MSSVDAPNVLTSTQKTLIRSWWKKATATNPRADSFRNIKTPIGERSIFGTALSESIKYAHSSISYIDNHLGVQCFGIIPTIIAKCGSYLKEEGLTTEGIFRLAGSAKRIGMLQQIFETPDQYGLQFDWIGYTVHDAASVMRRFLNHLPEPVITLDYYRPFKDTMAMSFASTEAKIEAFQTLIECLPLANQYLLLYILDMLGIFSRTCKVTRMDTACLAAVFAPGILSHPNDALSPAGYKESQLVLEFLIEHQERFTMPRSRIALVENSVLPRNPSTIGKFFFWLILNI